MRLGLFQILFWGKKITKPETLVGLGISRSRLHFVVPPPFLHMVFGYHPLCLLLPSLAKGKPLVGLSLLPFWLGGTENSQGALGPPSALRELGCTLADFVFNSLPDCCLPFPIPRSPLTKSQRVIGWSGVSPRCKDFRPPVSGEPQLGSLAYRFPQHWASAR